MTAATKKLAQRLLNLYYAGRPHGQSQITGDKCECENCQAWDEVESNPEIAFDDLESELLSK